MKRDEVASAVEHGLEYAESHLKTIGYIALALVVAGGLWGAFHYYSGGRNERANRELAKATKVFQAPIVATGAKPDDAKEPSFPNEAARRAKAKGLFEKVRQGFGSTDAGDVAGLYLANIAAAEGHLDEARKLWTNFVSHHADEMLAGEAQLNLIALDRKQGKTDAAIKTLEKLKEGKSALPLDVILNELGGAYEELHKPQEAIQAYRRILDEFPRSPYRNEAQQKVNTLDPTHPVAPNPMGAGGLGGFPG
jgi:predicted negative regulator of RcsB-dependent stress response